MKTKPKPKKNISKLERITRQAYSVARREAGRVAGRGYVRSWKDTLPAAQAGYMAMVKWVLKHGGAK